MSPPRASSRAKLTRLRAPVSLRRGALDVGGREVPLLSGAMHYWRLEPEAWKPALAELRGLHLPMVETYVPWGVHETAPGEFDFGETDPRRNLRRFLELAKEEDLLVFLRPGPHINAELTYFGIPERIIYDEACQARSPEGKPVILPFPPVMFPVPSYASRTFHEEAGRWFDAFAAEIKPYLFPNGPVVLTQVDNEAAFYFRNGPYCQDYHPDAIVSFRDFLKARYGTPEALAQTYRKPIESFESVNAPVRFSAEVSDELPEHIDWAHFQEELITDSLVRMRERLEEAGVTGIPFVHNVSLGDAGLPINMPAMASAVDLVGLDYYHARREYRTIKRRTLALAGTVDFGYSPELGVGAPPWFTPLSHDDSFFTALAALAYGVRGFNLYMAVDRDRWYGAPIDATGTPRIEAGSWKHLIAQLRAVDFHKLERPAEVGLLMPREYARLSRATHLLGPISPSILEAVGGTPVDACREDAFGFKGPVQTLWWNFIGRFADALTAEGIPYVYVDGDADASRFSRLRTLVVPSFEFASPATWRKICAFAKDGGHVVLGPAMPTLDDRMTRHPFEVPRQAELVYVDDQDDALRVVRELAQRLDLARPFRSSDPRIETSAHEGLGGPRVLFVANPASQSLKTTIALPAPTTFSDAMTGERFSGTGSFEIFVKRQSIRMLIVESQAHPYADAQVAGMRPRARRSR